MKTELLDAITAINYAEEQMAKDSDLVLADAFALEAIVYIKKYREWLRFKASTYKPEVTLPNTIG